MARSFQTKIEELVKAYERVVSDGEMANVESFHQQATTGFTSLTLVGAAIIDRYYDRDEKLSIHSAGWTLKVLKTS